MQDFLLKWCRSVVGPCEPLDRDERFHGRSAVSRLQTPQGLCYLKVHRERLRWEREVHAYERWTPALGHTAPQLLGVLEDGGFALLLGELPGLVMDKAKLDGRQQTAAWFEAGRTLAKLHAAAQGTFFGPCRRDGHPVETPIADAVAFITRDLERQRRDALAANLLSDQETATLDAVQRLVPAFAGEGPVPCHRDYYAGNWIVSDTGHFAGVFDFEFSAWDVPAADFTRSATWEWLEHPELLRAMQEGYGIHPSTRWQHQLLVAHAQYALSAITWGSQRSFHGYVQEGRTALAQLGKMLS